MLEMIRKAEKDLLATREKIRAKRREITGGTVEDRLKKRGEQVLMIALELVDEMELRLESLLNDLRKNVDQIKDKDMVKKIEADIEKLRGKIRDARRDITGGTVENKSRTLLKSLEEELTGLVDKVQHLRE